MWAVPVSEARSRAGVLVVASGVNVTFLIGNLGRDPKLTYIPSGTALCKFSIGVNERAKINGEWTSKVTWFDIVVWGKRGETVAEHLRKGSQVYIRGRIQRGEYESKKSPGQIVKTLDIIADDVQFLGGKPAQREASEQVDTPHQDDAPSRQTAEGGTTTAPSAAPDEPLPVLEDEPESEL
ncbi:hypothetical protein LCGC14_0441550 [marine sediment metagenome]|uniref:Single-stranded DNA-binding protein n=1 Tax=marine sediment metagenome TaxID=412755 RepID=A0A0F9VUL0_9ZZZZ